MTTLLISFLVLFNNACNSQEGNIIGDVNDSGYAIVQNVTVSGNEGGYTFYVTLKSPDKGCSQYANWWEVITEEDELVYRRILGHSHVNEQPFTRSGGTVKISATDIIIIRGHMNNAGYGEGEIAMKGSVKTGFNLFEMNADFGADLETMAPQPNGCAF